uniref:Secreted protein n=1 Tax=Pavo cristatus TaxID=9049 RepID=A0A8C9FQV8_PAVCR
MKLEQTSKLILFLQVLLTNIFCTEAYFKNNYALAQLQKCKLCEISFVLNGFRSLSTKVGILVQPKEQFCSAFN